MRTHALRRRALGVLAALMILGAAAGPAAAAGPWRSVAAGGDFTCALQTKGSVFCFGSNEHGQLGLPITTAQSTVPVRVPGLPPARAISVGQRFGCALTRSSEVWCWGATPYPAAGRSGVVDADPFHPDPSPPAQAPGAKHVKQLTTSDWAVCWIAGAKRRPACFGALRKFPWDEYGPTAFGPGRTPGEGLSAGLPGEATGLAPLTDIALTESSMCLRTAGQPLRSGQRVKARNRPRQICVTKIEEPYRDYLDWWHVNAADRRASGRIVSAGRTACVVQPKRKGLNCRAGYGQNILGFPEDNVRTTVTGLAKGATAIASTNTAACMIVRERLRCSQASARQPTEDQPHPEAQISLRSGDLEAGPVTARVRALSAGTRAAVPGDDTHGREHWCVVTKAGDLICWGDDDHGQLGRGAISTEVPQRVAAVTGATAVTAGVRGACATIAGGGAPVCWGDQDNVVYPVPDQPATGVGCQLLADGTATCLNQVAWDGAVLDYKGGLVEDPVELAQVWRFSSPATAALTNGPLTCGVLSGGLVECAETGWRLRTVPAQPAL